MFDVLYFGVAMFVAQVPAQDITIGPDPRPTQLVSQFSAVCNNHAVLVQLQTDPKKDATLTQISIDGRDVTNNPLFAEVKQFVPTLEYPSVSAVYCPAGRISFVVSGRPKVGTDTLYRVSFPIDLT